MGIELNLFDGLKPERPAGWVSGFLDDLRAGSGYAGELGHVAELDGRSPTFADPAPGLALALDSTLERLEVPRLYSHQVEVLDHARAGRDLVVVTGTASGKSLAYNIPILETLLHDPQATALYLFPTTALAQDQLQGLRRLAEAAPASLGELIRAGTYDGDTTPHSRRKLRENANLILSNPDMLHQGILPHHTRWSRFLAALSIIVVDEVHVYRGIFGSQVANVLRRLFRLAAHYGARPRVIASSATIGNAGELASRLLGRPVAEVLEDGSSRGRKTVAFWNPAPLDPQGFARRSANLEAARHLIELMGRGVATIVFTKSRVAAELVYRYASEGLVRRGGGLASRLSAYRAGYLPAERREIEARLFSGELLGVVSTTALELGIDVGALDCAILVGFPSTIASAWQQIGRAGRGVRESLALVVAHEDPVDQYLVRNPRHFFARSPECAVIDPENPYVLAGHLGCAAHELPLTDADLASFGGLAEPVADLLAEEKQLAVLEGQRFWSSPEFPARSVNLRTISDDTYTILDAAEEGRVVGTVDAVSGLELVYPEAVYLHEGESYVVRELDLEQKVALVERMTVDYYTQPVLDTAIRVLSEETRRGLGEEAGRGVGPVPREGRGGRDPSPAPVGASSGPLAVFGEVEVSWQTVAMKKIQFRTRDSIGYHPLQLPRLTLPTRGMWIWVGEEVLDAVSQAGSPYGPLGGLRNLLVTVLPLLAMCDPTDIGGVIDSRNLGRPCIYIFDRYPGGLGFAEQGYVRLEELLCAAAELARACPCRDGCPSCVALPILHPAQQQDPDLGRGHPMPSKLSTLELVDGLERHLGAATAGRVM
jgi:DEAD/DEAH box helicase domain-containing protein